jgi:hypothetical protein
VKTAGPDLVKDLMKLDMGVLYKKIIKDDQDRKSFGFLPLEGAPAGGYSPAEGLEGQ